jgi:hypothetical protein
VATVRCPWASAVCQQLPNANSYAYNLRAILIALKGWVVNGAAPPDSLYALIGADTLVAASRVKFPVIPSVSEQLGELLRLFPQSAI